ncbi:MAG: hypothetical protein R3362_05660, partial [Rhodothermales bacterium]|nr:hypothetical protein [Rhodothermales bacterium]
MRALVFTPLLLAVALLPMLAGCDTTEATVEDAAAAPSPMFAAAPLSDTTASVVRTALERYADGGRRPGALWTAAADLAGTLTGAQQAELIAAAPDGWRGPRWTGRRALPRRALTGLGLSDAQRAALRSIREAYRPELRALRLTARSGDGPFDAHRERFEALRAAFRADVDAVLTDEQRAALDAKRAARQERRGRHAPGA